MLLLMWSGAELNRRRLIPRLSTAYISNRLFPSRPGAARGPHGWRRLGKFVFFLSFSVTSHTGRGVSPLLVLFSVFARVVGVLLVLWQACDVVAEAVHVFVLIDGNFTEGFLKTLLDLEHLGGVVFLDGGLAGFVLFVEELDLLLFFSLEVADACIGVFFWPACGAWPSCVAFR